MKILLINNFHYRFGGASVVYLNTAEVLQNKGHQVSFFSIKDQNNLKSSSEKYFIEKKVTAEDSLKNKTKNITNYFYNKQATLNLKKLLEIEKPDIAHIHLFYGGITSSIFSVLKNFGIPIIHTVHDYRLICPAYTFLDVKGEICEECSGKYFYKCAFKKCSKGNLLQSFIMAGEMYYRNAKFNPVNNIDGFCFVSNFSKNKHLKYLPGLSTKSTEVLYNFADEKKTAFKDKENYLLFFGRISQEKGLLTLLSVIKDMPNVYLKIVGTGPQEEEIKNIILSNKLNNVELLGFKSGEELTNIIAKAYFVIVPSEWYENNPMTIIEAYSNCTPVIGAAIGGIGEIVIEDKTGFTFESRNCIDLAFKLNKALSLQPQEYNLFCENAFNFALLNFNKENYYKKLMSFYSKIIENYKNEKLN